jgi:hypothetical protein
MSLSSPSTRRKLLLDSDEAPEDDQPNAWTCSYVMSSGDGVNLLGTLDVDRNRARFVANSGLFGTAYQFVMPRDQIQIVRVPTASSPYNALELHTKYRQNILCDFDDNVATFKRCCEVMKLDVLPQDEPLIAVLPTDVSDHANKWRARAAQKRREREAAEALAARGGGEPDDGHQLTQQVMHLHGEKVALQRRMVELERENEHLHGEVEVLYAQVDEQSERSQRQREALEAAAREALDDVLAADMEKERTKAREAAREKEKLRGEASQREEGEKENEAVTPPDSALEKAEQEARAEVSEAEKLKNVQRQDELVASVASLREERAMFEGEVARLRLELERRDAEREEKLANADADDANAENAENKASSSLDAEERDDDMQDMLAMEVQRLLAKQAELSNHLARAQREKEMLEKENELLYQQTEAVEEDAQTARFERALAWERLSEAESAAGFRVLETAIAPSSPPRDNDVVSPSVSSRASPIKAGGPPIGSGSALPKMEKASDGPDAELAAKLIGRLERGGESDEAASLKLEMERMKAELGRMKAERAESLGRSRVGSDAASETKPSEEDERRRSGEDTGDSASATAAAALRAALEKKEEELRIERRRVAKEIAAATKRAAAEASAREKEEALWRVTEAELRAADAERALEALRVEKEESERALALATEELRSERSRSRAGSVSASLSQAGDRTRDSQNDGSRVSLPFGVPLPDPPGFGTDDRTSSDGGWSVPERVWQEILLEKESALSALSASDKAKEDEIERLRERLSKLERRAKKEASTHEGSTPSPPKRSVSRSVKSSPATAFNETFAGVGKLPAIDVSGKSVTRLDSPTAKATSPEYAKSPRSPFAKGLTGLGVAAAGFVFGKLSPQ